MPMKLWASSLKDPGLACTWDGLEERGYATEWYQGENFSAGEVVVFHCLWVHPIIRIM